MMDSTGRTVLSVASMTKGNDTTIRPFTDRTGEEKPVSSIGETGNFTYYDQGGRAYVAETGQTSRSDGFAAGSNVADSPSTRTDKAV